MKRDKKRNFNHLGSSLRLTLYYAVMAVFMIAAILPLYVVLVTSVTSYQETTSTMSFVWWPKQGLDFSAYRTVLFDDIFARTSIPTLILGFINTFWISIVQVSAQLFFSGLAAYAYSKLNFRLKEQTFLLQLVTMMIPTACMTVTFFMFYRWLGWTDSYLPVVVPGMFGSATTIFFLRGFFNGIPTSLFDAAKMDGMGTFGCYLHVAIPLAKPAFIAQLIFAFLSVYNSYTGPLLYLTKDHQVTLQLALTQIADAYPSYVAVKCAASVIGLIPMIIIFLVFQRYFIEGIMAGGVKE